MSGGREGGNKREQILEAAAVVFARKGLYRAKVEEIAAEAGVGKGTVYEYFDSKKDLFKNLLRETTNRYFGALSKKLERASLAKEKIYLLFQFHLDFIRENRGMAGVLLLEHHLFGEDFMKWVCRQQFEKMQHLEGMIRDGIASGQFRPANPELTAQMIAALIISTGNYYLMKQDADVDEIVSAATDFILYGLSPENSCKIIQE